MQVVVFTRLGGGCKYCEDLVAYLRSNAIAYEEIQVDRRRLEEVCKASGCRQVTFPRAFIDSKLVGGHADVLDIMEDPLLRPSADRLVYFPIKYPRLHELYKTGVACFWTPEEIDLSKDAEDWQRLSTPERRFFEKILAFFAGADGIVNENLVANMCNTVQAPEARAFYSFQAFNETQHAETYSLLLDFLVKDVAEKERLFAGISTIPSVGLKASWALRWLEGSGNARFAERLVAFACVEGIMFSSSFCAIFWLRKRGLMPGLCLSNDFIARDEGLHQSFACALLGLLKRKPLPATILEIVRDAVTVEQSFVRDLLPENLIGMTATDMCSYVEYVADNLLNQLGMPAHYHTHNPFEWMETIGLSSKANFFEVRNSSYAKASKADTFSLDADF